MLASIFISEVLSWNSGITGENSVTIESEDSINKKSETDYMSFNSPGMNNEIFKEIKEENKTRDCF